MSPTIAFVRKGPWPPANVSAVQALRSAYPAADIDEIDLLPLLRRHPGWVALNSLWMAKEYGRDLWLHRRSLKESFLITSLAFRLLRTLANQCLRRRQYTFSFQMQSLFDASLPGLAHFVYTDHTLLINQSYPGVRPRHLYSAAWRRLEPQIYQHARRVFTRAENVRQSLLVDYGCAPERVVCVYVGCNVPGEAAPRSVASYTPGRVLFVGIDWERKGGPELLSAWRSVAPEFPAARLILVGCTPNLAGVPQAQAMGRLPLSALQRLYQTASIFCMPTHLEPFGVAVLEAMAHRLPVITTRVGGLPEVVVDGGSGLLVEPGTEAQLAVALRSLLADPARCAQLGAAGLDRLRTRYTWPAVGLRLRGAIDAAL